MSGKKEIVFEETAGPDGSVRFLIPGRRVLAYDVIVVLLLVVITSLYFWSTPYPPLLILLIAVIVYWSYERGPFTSGTEVVFSNNEISIRHVKGRYSKRPTVVGLDEISEFVLAPFVFAVPYSKKSHYHNHRLNTRTPFVKNVLLKDRGGHIYCICEYLRKDEKRRLCERLNEILKTFRVEKEECGRTT